MCLDTDLLKKFPIVYGTWSFMVFLKDGFFTYPAADDPVQALISFLYNLLILLSYIHICIVRGIFLWDFTAKCSVFIYRLLPRL